MTLQLWSTFATFGTFVVIAAAAIAALVQLRRANQIAAMAELQDASQTPQFIAALHVVYTELASKLKDSEFRYQVANRGARTSENQAVMTHANIVGNYYENMGLLVRMGLVDRDLALSIWSATAGIVWDLLAPYAAIARQLKGDALWENFEYFVVLSQDWVAARPKGAYPAGVRRIALKNAWLEADVQYAASRASG